MYLITVNICGFNTVPKYLCTVPQGKYKVGGHINVATHFLTTIPRFISCTQSVCNVSHSFVFLLEETDYNTHFFLYQHDADDLNKKITCTVYLVFTITLCQSVNVGKQGRPLCATDIKFPFLLALHIFMDYSVTGSNIIKQPRPFLLKEFSWSR